MDLCLTICVSLREFLPPVSLHCASKSSLYIGTRRLAATTPVQFPSHQAAHERFLKWGLKRDWISCGFLPTNFGPAPFTRGFAGPSRVAKSSYRVYLPNTSPECQSLYLPPSMSGNSLDMKSAAVPRSTGQPDRKWDAFREGLD